jgi:hypothetical protein
MTAAAPITIPISFLGEVPTGALAVDEAGLRRLLGYEGRAPSTAKDASWRFRQKFGIRTLPGGVYSLEEIHSALRVQPLRKGSR